MTATAIRPELEALELLHARTCVPACCLAATGQAARCKCRCGGTGHGLMLAGLMHQDEPAATAEPDRTSTQRARKGRKG